MLVGSRPFEIGVAEVDFWLAGLKIAIVRERGVAVLGAYGTDAPAVRVEEIEDEGQVKTDVAR